MDTPMKLKKAKRWDPSYGMLATKSTGDPLLDRISVLMAEHNHAVDTRRTLERMQQLLTGPGTEVQITLALDITSGHMTPLELEKHLVDDNPDLKDLLDGPDAEAYRDHIQNSVQEMISSGQDRAQTHLQVSFPMPAHQVNQLVRTIYPEAPLPNPGAAAQALRDLADKVESG
jgi:hypothetical protein